MPLSEMAFKEALRLKPPVPSMPRRAVRDFTFKGFAIPAGTMVGVNPLFTHHMPEIWPDPDTFDPMRFTDEAQRNRHRFAWVPFGGGAHMCLGLHFAYMQAKCFARHFLQNLSVSLEPGYTAGLADVADPEAAGWIEGRAEGGLKFVRWAKARLRRVHHSRQRSRMDGGHGVKCAPLPTLRFSHAIRQTSSAARPHRPRIPRSVPPARCCWHWPRPDARRRAARRTTGRP